MSKPPMTYLQSMELKDKIILEALISESPHTNFKGAPPEYSFMNSGIVDLGFENMNLGEQSHKILHKGFYHTGIIIPNTPYKIRGVDLIHAVFELYEPDEDLPILPDNWVDMIYVYDTRDKKFVYIGKNVRTDQLL